MQPLYHELSTLAKSVQFKNLSAAAEHVGLSQSQLSRIIAKIEDELQVVLLERSAKRSSGWTPVAFKIAEIFERNNRRLETEIFATRKDQMAAELHIGALEGLAGLAMQTAKSCFEIVGVRKISLDLFDVTELEAKFVSGHLDLIFSSRMPGRQKFKYVEELGHQDLEEISGGYKFGVFSTFEYHRASLKTLEKFDHVLISNSLHIKREWFKNVGGTGKIPGAPKTGTAKEGEQIYMIGSEVLSPALWKQIVKAVDLEEA